MTIRDGRTPGEVSVRDNNNVETARVDINNLSMMDQEARDSMRNNPLLSTLIGGDEVFDMADSISQSDPRESIVQRTMRQRQNLINNGVGNYPNDVEEMLDPNMKFKGDVLRAVKKFKRNKEYRIGKESREEGMKILLKELSTAYGIPEVGLANVATLMLEMNGRADLTNNKIWLGSRLSLITLLHEFAHMIGKNEIKACKWSLNLFKRIYPRAFERLIFVGHMARRP